MKQKQHEMSLVANERQVGGNHYKKMGVLQHWDVVAMFNLDYFQGNITKYVMRWRDKNGVEDLKKAQHYLQKYVEIEDARSDGLLTRVILERAILELEGIEQQEEQAAAYRAQAKGDDPIKDLTGSYPFKLVEDDGMTHRQSAERGAPTPVLPAEENAKRQPSALGHDEHGPIFKKDLDADSLRDGVIRRKSCTHGADDCPVHPNGGCPPLTDIDRDLDQWCPSA